MSMSHRTAREIAGLNSLVVFQGSIVLERLQRMVWKNTAMSTEDLAELIRGARNFLDSLQDLSTALGRENAQKE